MRRALRLGVFGGTQGVGKEGAVPSESENFVRQTLLSLAAAQ